MGQGRVTQAHYNSVLSRLAVDYTPPDLAGRDVMPIINVSKRSDVFPIFDKAMYDVVEDRRASGDEARSVTRGWKYDQYLVENHALKEYIDDDTRDNWDSEVDLEANATEYLKQLVWNRYEQRLFGSSGLFRTAGNQAGSANVSWATLSSASPRTDVNTGIETVESASGRTPNTIILTPRVARHIMLTAEYREEFKYAVDIRDEGSAGDLPSEFYGMKAVYVKSLLNTAQKGQAVSLSRIMSDDVWLGYLDPNPGYKTLTWGVTILMDEQVKSWYDNDRSSTVIEYEVKYTPKVIATECGYLMTSVLT